jgi:flagellar biosynthesis/type III secretory pathway protein FliH
MQTRTRLLPAALSFALAVVFLPATSVSRAAAEGSARNDDNSPAVNAPATTPQQQAGALERGYRTGYSDGYQAGYRDSIDRAERDYRNKEEYGRADRAYIPAYGSPEDYRDGYQQGFEIGYDAGFDRRGFDSIVPPGLARRPVPPRMRA